MKEKEYIIEELEMVCYHSNEAIETMRKVYGKDFVNAKNLEGAVSMIKEWIECVLGEINEESDECI